MALSACATASRDAGNSGGTCLTGTARSEALRHRLRDIAAFCSETIPGFQVACIVDGAVAWSEGCGVRASDGARTDAETIFDFGSLTKPVFATAVLRLIEQGVREVFDPLGMRRASVVFEPSFRANYAQGFRNNAAAAIDSYNKQNADRVAAVLGVDTGALKAVSTLALCRAAATATTTAATAGERLPSPVLTPVLAAGSLQTTAADCARFATAFMRGSATAGLHSGYNSGFHSFALGDPHGRFGIVVTSHSDRGDGLRWPVVLGATDRGEAAIFS